MSDIILPVIGATAGFMLGGPAGVLQGAQLLGAAASAFGPRTQRVHLPTREGPRLADLRAQTSTYGNMIPQVYGMMRLAGNILWATDIIEKRRESTTTQSARAGGKGGGGRRVVTSQMTITYII